jgi:3',5'-cyclic AMP phosphodiesterase CpdA
VILLAQLSDLHVDGSARAAERVTRAMDLLRAQPTPPDALIVTGDVANSGKAAEYEEVLRLTEAPFPVYFCPGNHDERSTFREVLLGAPAADGPINQVHRVGDLTVLMCDSIIPGKDGGLLDAGTLGWIEETLGGLGSGQAAFLAFHHPPVPVRVPMADAMLLQNPEELADLLSRHPEVIAVANGHTHTAAASVLAGRPVLLGPAVTWTLRLPSQGDPVADREDAPGVAFHCVEGREVVTHFRSAR